MVADLRGPFAHVGHMTIGTGHTGARVDALRPQFELRVLGLEDGRARLLVAVVEERPALDELGLVPVSLDLFDLQAFAPRESQWHLRRAVILHVTLTADIRAHLVSARIGVGVVGSGPVALSPLDDGSQRRHGGVGRGQRLDAANEPGSGDPQRHRLGVMTIHTAHGVGLPRLVEHGADLLIALLVGLVQTLHRIAVPELAIQRHDRGVAVQTGARLRFREALRRLLILQHVGVAASVSVVDGERVAEEHALEPGIALDLLLWHGLVPAMPAEACFRRPGRALVAVVLGGPVLAPDGRIGRVVIDLDHPHEG